MLSSLDVFELSVRESIEKYRPFRAMLLSQVPIKFTVTTLALLLEQHPTHSPQNPSWQP
jgi:hypothetical protein